MNSFGFCWGGVRVILAPDGEGKKNPKGAVRAAVQRWEMPPGGLSSGLSCCVCRSHPHIICL